MSKIKFSEDQINILCEKIISLLNLLDKRNFIPFDGLNKVMTKHKAINSRNIKGIFDLIIKYDNNSISSFSNAVKHFVEKSNEAEIREFIYNFLGVTEISEETIFSEDYRFERLGYAVSLLNEGERKEISKIIIKRLHEKFDAEFYAMASVFEMIDYDENLFAKFLNTVPDQTKRKNEFRGIFSQDDNHRLGQAINLMYKYDMPFTKEVRDLANFSIQKDYYTWLMDLDNFDYSKFNIYWVLEYQTKYYFKAFKKSKKLKSVIQKSLKKNYIEGVARLYFNNLI